MVIDQLNVFSAFIGPFETDSPLLVDSDAVRAGAVALQLLESIAWGDPQVAENLGGFEDQQLPESHSLGAVVELAGTLPLPDPLGFLVSERPDHVSNNNGQRY